MVIPPQWIPNPIVWSNYVDVFVQVPLTLYIRNSMTDRADRNDLWRADGQPGRLWIRSNKVPWT